MTKSMLNATKATFDTSIAEKIPAIEAAMPISVILDIARKDRRSLSVMLMLGLNITPIAIQPPIREQIVSKAVKINKSSFMVSLLSKVSVAILQILIQRKENCNKNIALHNLIIKYFTQYVKNMWI